MAQAFLALWPLALIVLGCAGYRWHAGRTHQTPNVVDLADAKARREQAQRVPNPDLKPIHFGGDS